ncbi:MAG: elongator complex protein 3 [Fusobacteriaceae bacterium]
MRHYNIPIFINHVGCPNSCVFCSQQKINGVETDITPEEVKEIIDEYLGYLPKNTSIEVAFFGGTFTGISFELQKKYLEVVKSYMDSGRVQGIRLSTRPDCIDDKILTQLKENGVKVIELGVQSLDQKVLDLTERNYPVSAVEEAVKKIKSYGIQIGIQLMVGLPGSDYNKDYFTAEKALEMKPDMIRIYPSLVLKDTEMENMYREGRYLPLTLESAIDITKKIYSLFIVNGINVIRVGLQPSDDLREEGVIVAGPFHPAFRELVEGEIYYDFFKEILEKEKKLEIVCNEKNRSKIIGNKGKNRNRLQGKLNLKIESGIDENEISINGKIYKRDEIFRRGIK